MIASSCVLLLNVADSSTASLSDSNIHDEARLWCSFQSSNFGPIDSWNTSNVRNMSHLFHSKECESFNDDIENWDVSAVSDMSYMFYGASLFNGYIANWNVSAVTDMAGMFKDASHFNTDISTWDVSAVDDMSYMFYGAMRFDDEDLMSWEISIGTNTSRMFAAESKKSFSRFTSHRYY